MLWVAATHFSVLVSLLENFSARIKMKSISFGIIFIALAPSYFASGLTKNGNRMYNYTFLSIYNIKPCSTTTMLSKQNSSKNKSSSTLKDWFFLADSNCFYESLDLIGFDVLTVSYIRTRFECRDSCKKNPNCLFFVFQNATLNCYHKSSNAGGNVTDANCTTGKRWCKESKFFQHFLNTL